MGPSKGILIFTHKEVRLFNPALTVVAARIQQVRNRYVIGMHWGHWSRLRQPIPYVDFHLSGPTTLQRECADQTPILNFCSRDFIPSCFRPLDVPKLWDVVTVSRNVRLKNLDQLLHVVRGLLKRRPDTRVLIVCPESGGSSRSVYREIYRDYKNLLSSEQRRQVQLLLIRGDGDPFPLPPEVIASFYQQSRIFTLFTDVEGESRVIAEALLCGLPVVVKQHLKGGGRDYLDGMNSRQFTNLMEAEQCFLDLLAQPLPCIDHAAVSARIGETNSRLRFETALKDLFATLGLPWEGELAGENLSRALPSHTMLLPRHLVANPYLDDLKSPAAALAFLEMMGAKSSTSFQKRIMNMSNYYLMAKDVICRAHRKVKKIATLSHKSS